MNNSQAEVVAQLLIDMELGTDPLQQQPWPVQATGEPDSPDDCITVYDQDGTSDGRTMVDGEALLHRGLQIRVRSSEHPEGWQKANDIRERLAAEVNMAAVRIGTAAYTVACVARIGPVRPLGKETPSTKRSLFTLNAVAHVRETS